MSHTNQRIFGTQNFGTNKVVHHFMEEEDFVPINEYEEKVPVIHRKIDKSKVDYSWLVPYLLNIQLEQIDIYAKYLDMRKMYTDFENEKELKQADIGSSYYHDLWFDKQRVFRATKKKYNIWLGKYKNMDELVFSEEQFQNRKDIIELRTSLLMEKKKKYEKNKN